MNIPIAINQSMLMQSSTEEFLHLCNKNGFRHVELRIPKLKETLYATPVSQIQNLLKKYEIEVVTINAMDGYSMVPDENLKFLELECSMIAHLCTVTECDVVVAPVGQDRQIGLNVQEIKNRAADRLKFIADYFAQYNIKVGYEPIGFPEFTINNLDLSEEIIQTSNAKNVGYVIDIYNLWRNTITAQDVLDRKRDMFIVHINDIEDKPKEELNVMTTRTFPGEGKGVAYEWIRTFLENGYTGCFSLEIFNEVLWKKPPDEAFHIISNKLGECMGKLYQ